MILEICAGSLTSAINAQAGGATRIELCDNLPEGGTTPSAGVTIQTLKLLSIPVFVLIRPRAGDFLYSDAEFEAMKADVLYCKEHRAKGVVLGMLREDGSVDVDRTVELVKLARPMKVTFHRAFDMTADPYRAMEDLIGMGIERVLTSGQAATARDGVPVIANLVRRAAGRITVMPGGGINEDNIAYIRTTTRAKEFHASLRGPVNSKMTFSNPRSNMGNTVTNEYAWLETDPERVRRVMSYEL